jgi:uncharacterized membrane protein
MLQSINTIERSNLIIYPHLPPPPTHMHTRAQTHIHTQIFKDYSWLQFLPSLLFKPLNIVECLSYNSWIWKCLFSAKNIFIEIIKKIYYYYYREYESWRDKQASCSQTSPLYLHSSLPQEKGTIYFTSLFSVIIIAIIHLNPSGQSFLCAWIITHPIPQKVVSSTITCC